MTYPPQPGQWNPGPPPPGYYPPPQKQGGGIKWLLIAIVVLLVVTISVGVTIAVFLARDDSGSDGNSSTAAPNVSDIASANDTGPVAIISVEPTCAAWRTIQTTLANAESNGWGERDPLSASSSWSPQVRTQYETVGAAMRSAADQSVSLAKQTPHRVMREMYEQLIAYGRAYADSLSSYQPKDDFLSLANVYLTGSIGAVCDAIENVGLADRVPSLPAVQPPTSPPLVSDLSQPVRFVSGPSVSCAAWTDADSALRSKLVDWISMDTKTLATAWTPEERRIAEGAARAFDTFATTMISLGQQEKGAFEDFATLGALYLRTYVAATPTYTPSDRWISMPGLRLNNAINSACKAVVS